MKEPDTQPLVLHANAIVHRDTGAFAVIHLLRGRDGTPHGGARLLVVVDGVERQLDVHVGETFPVGDQTWRLDEVQMPDNHRFTATFLWSTSDAHATSSGRADPPYTTGLG